MKKRVIIFSLALLILLGILLFGTDIKEKVTGQAFTPPCEDNDGDSFNSFGWNCGTEDCDDNDPQIYPGAEEICNGKDDDCDTIIDNGVDSDGGDDLLITDYDAGEICINNDVVKEYWCDTQGQLQNEPKSCASYVGTNSFCYDGSCNTCADSDSPGINYTVKGETFNISNLDSPNEDYCIDSMKLNESFCSDNDVSSQIYDCSLLGSTYTCQEGQCFCEPNYVLDTCYSDDTALFKDASTCQAPDYVANYDCDGNGIILNDTCLTLNAKINNNTIDEDINYTEKGMQLIKLEQHGSGGTEFYWNFSKNLFDFCQINIETSNNQDSVGYTIVKNANINNKSVLVERINKSKQICIIDEADISIDDFSQNCDEPNEILVSCPGKKARYNCEIAGDQFKIWPLNHSAVKEMIAETSSCTPDWSYGDWGVCINGTQTRDIVDLNNCEINQTDSQICTSTSCTPNWQCRWGDCIDGIKYQTCTDTNNCGDDSNKPAGESYECKKQINSLIIILISLIVLLLIILAMVYFLKRNKIEKEDSGNNVPPPVAPKPPTPPSSPRATPKLPASPPMNFYTPKPVRQRPIAPS